MFAGTGPEAGSRLRFYYFRKRVNDFYFFGQNEKMILLFGVGRGYEFTDEEKESGGARM